MAGENWDIEEIEAAVTDYFRMLVSELRGEIVNKAEHNRRLRGLITKRSKGSIEFKHQNISAVLIELGYPYISGYKPRRNYQDLLATVVQERLQIARQTGLDKVLDEVISQPAFDPKTPPDLLTIEKTAPVAPSSPAGLREHFEHSSLRIQRNYLAIEASNQALGLAGENLILSFEHERLWRAGAKQLADKIEHVAKTKGDQLGYDIHSFETNGADRLIEVKTTRFGEMTPFFASANEVDVSNQRASEYHLYRLFDFTNEPRLFRLQGSLQATCTLKANQFTASPWKY